MEDQRNLGSLMMCLSPDAIVCLGFWDSSYLAAFHCVCSRWMFDVKQRQKDNVFVTVVTSIQYWALSDKAADAFYKLSNTRAQIQSHVFDVNRASVPKLVLDSVFEQKN